MPNIGVVLRDEIRRLARSEINKSVDLLRKDNARLKRDVAELKRQLADLNRDARRIFPEVVRLRQTSVDPEAKEVKEARFGPKLIAALRRRLKLTREQFSNLARVSANTVYLWEKGLTAPRPAARAILVELRGIGVREARHRLKETSGDS